MKLAFAVVVAVVACGVAAAQNYYDGAAVPPSMYAAQAGMAAPMGLVNPNGIPVPAAPVFDMMAGSQMPQYGAYPPQAAFVEAPQAQAAPFATEEAETVEETSEEDEEEADEESSDEEAVEGDDARFQQAQWPSLKGLKEKAKKAFEEAKHHGKKLAAAAKKHAKKAAKKLKKLAKKLAKKAKKAAKKAKKAGKKFFKPKSGKPSNDARSPSAKTPKAAGGRKLPPMPAPLPKKFKISCKLNPARCIEAETPAEGDEPGDHSPKAIFKKKMEVIKKSLMVNNRNIAQESKWIDQVELMIKQYALKVKKVKEHIADERKAIKELLRQRRIIINEKKQRELEQKLKMATAELTSLTDALGQVVKKESELKAGKTTLGTQIKSLATGLATLRTNNEAEKKDALKKADF